MINSGLNVAIPEIPIPAFEVPNAAPMAMETQGKFTSGQIFTGSGANSLLNTICGKTWSLSDNSKKELEELTYGGGYTGKPEERCIWWAGRHGRTKIMWVAFRMSWWSSGSLGRERSADYRIRKGGKRVPSSHLEDPELVLGPERDERCIE